MSFLLPTSFCSMELKNSIRVEIIHNDSIEEKCINWASGFEDPFKSRWSYLIVSQWGEKKVHAMFENIDDAIMFKLLS